MGIYTRKSFTGDVPWSFLTRYFRRQLGSWGFRIHHQMKPTVSNIQDCLRRQGAGALALWGKTSYWIVKVLFACTLKKILLYIICI